MFRGKPLQEGCAQAARGVTWQSLAAMSPTRSGEGRFPRRLQPLPHRPPEAAWWFPKSTSMRSSARKGATCRASISISTCRTTSSRIPAGDLLTTRKDAGTTSPGKLVTIITLRAVQRDPEPEGPRGLRLLVTPFRSSQFNQTEDRRSEVASRGVTCFDCQVNGHTMALPTRSAISGRSEFPSSHRHAEPARCEHPAQLRSQRALSSVEDFTNSSSRGYFDGDHSSPPRRGSTSWSAAARSLHGELQKLLDFPPPQAARGDASSIRPGRPSRAARKEVFFARAVRDVHLPPHYTDNTMHDLHTERFFKQELVDGGDGRRRPIKTFPLRASRSRRPTCTTGACSRWTTRSSSSTLCSRRS